MKARSGATLKPFAVQSNPKAGYLFASVQRWTDEKAYFARIEHGILEIHGSTEEALAEALSPRAIFPMPPPKRTASALTWPR